MTNVLLCNLSLPSPIAIDLYFVIKDFLHLHFPGFFLICLNWRIIALQYCVDFIHTSTWISHRYIYVPSLLNLLPHPTPSHPFRLSQNMFELDESHCKFPLRIYLYMVMCMFQCYSLNLPHPLLPPLCPQVCSLCLCLHCSPANRYISAIFLDFIYTH